MVVPACVTVLAPVADLRATADHDAELVDQVHFEETLTVLATRAGWHFVQADDHYVGWIPEDAVRARDRRDGRVVGRVLAAVHVEADADSRVIGYLPAGTPLADTDGPWVRIAPAGYVAADDAADLRRAPHRPPAADDLIATAEAFLGVPYLWGGTTGLGLDCSGYVQQVYRLNGLRLDRDADQQAVEGRPVEVAAPGDLIFFGTDRVTHVALATGERTFLNAPETGRRVERGSLGEGRTVLAIRRYLP